MDQQELLLYKNVGLRIKEIRTKQGLSQGELAERANLSLPAVNSIENGRSKMWLSSFVKICEALRVSPDDLLRLETPVTTFAFPKEFEQLLDGCTAAETEAIIKLCKSMKLAFTEQKQRCAGNEQ